MFDLPGRLWAEVKRDQKANFRTLAKAQAALAVALLSYIPLRLQNLTVLTFGTHLFMSDAVRASSTLELSAGEVKNGTELAFDIPRRFVGSALCDHYLESVRCEPLQGIDEPNGIGVGHTGAEDASELPGQMRHPALQPIAFMGGNDIGQRLHQAWSILA